MIKVITYGTFDFFHYGHQRLLERAKALGDYLVVGITADDFDKSRGKINVQQSLIERIQAVQATGLADEIIVEEYEGQKIDDIKRLGIDIFTVGSDWVGHFDYLSEFCKVVYQERTQGVSSSEIRSQKRIIRLGIVGEATFINKLIRECDYVNGIQLTGLCTLKKEVFEDLLEKFEIVTENYEEMIDRVDAVYIASAPNKHYTQVKMALNKGKHVMCESPMTLSEAQCKELIELANHRDLTLYEGLKTAYFTAYSRLLLLAKTGKIGDIVSVDAVCTQLQKIDFTNEKETLISWNSLYEWGPTALLPIFQILGTEYRQMQMVSRKSNENVKFDDFTKVTFIYPKAVASIKVGKGVKSEGELIISGTKGYIYVPAPWWKTDYFEIRYENPADNKRYFYQLEGEGLRYELVFFLKAIERRNVEYVSKDISLAIARVMGKYENGTELITLDE